MEGGQIADELSDLVQFYIGEDVGESGSALPQILEQDPEMP